MKLLRVLLAWLIALLMLVLRATCRKTVHDDPRPKLREAAEPYIYSILHAHQVAAAIKREKGTAAMVSRSADGELLSPAFRVLGIKAIRGSSRGRGRGRDKGGLAALDQLVQHIKTGAPAYLAVDGPRGPRNHVRKGVAVLSRDSGAAVINAVVVPSGRWILRGAWDRLQIPYPFSHIDIYFTEPLRPLGTETIEQFRHRIETSLCALETLRDPSEARQIKTSNTR